MRALITKVVFTGGYLLFHLNDGRILGEELIKEKELMDATPEQLVNYQLIDDGDGVYWPDLDMSISMNRLFRIPQSSPCFQRSEAGL